jgi:sporulation protein YlmC with PRC-barrel domain
MSYRNTSLFGAAFLAVLTCTAGAQNEKQPDSSKAKAAPVASSGRAAGIARASDVVGTNIIDAADKGFGEVKDILFCGETGEAVLIIERDAGNDLIAAPLALFSARVDDKTVPAKDGAVGDPVATLKVDKLIIASGADKLATAPVIADKDKLSSLDDAWWDRFATNYGLPTKAERMADPAKDRDPAGREKDGTVSASKGEHGTGMVCVEKLIGQDVKTTGGEDIGDVKDIALDLGTSKVAYVVISTGGVMGVGSALHGVTVDALLPDAEHKYVTLNTDKTVLDRTQGIDIDKLPTRPNLQVGAAKPSSTDRGEKDGVTPR